MAILGTQFLNPGEDPNVYFFSAFNNNITMLRLFEKCGLGSNFLQKVIQDQYLAMFSGGHTCCLL